MICEHPYKQGVAEFPCWRCMPCRLNRRRLWTIRLLLEQRVHAVPAWFVTLTYNDENLPIDDSVSPRHLQLFLKRLRAAVAPARIRFYGVGEYGDLSYRPHYHLVVYGLPAVVHLGWPDEKRGCDCVICKAWTLGRVFNGELTAESAAYVVSYTTKRLTRADAIEWASEHGHPALKGRHPEFARMSLRPHGIGAKAMGAVGASLTASQVGAEYVSAHRDVPPVVRLEGRMWPLGRYLRRKLREEVGMDPGQDAAAAERQGRKMQGELSAPGARAAREEKRRQGGRRANALNRISNSKKGIGL